MSSINLKFLTEDELIIEICTLYWSLDNEIKFKYSVTDLTKTYRLTKNQLSELVKQNCQAFTTKKQCLTCGDHYIFSNRTTFVQFEQANKRLGENSLTTWNCSRCEKEEKQNRIEQEKKIAQQKRYIIQDVFSLEKRDYVDWQEITLENAVYFLALFRLGASEDLTYIRSLGELSKHLSPSDEFSHKIIKQLYQARLIYIHPASPISAFIFDGIDISEFYLHHVLWALPKSSSQSEPELISELEEIFRTKEWPDHWDNETGDLWRKIALEECLQYLKISLEDHGFVFSPGEKTTLVIKGALAHFSVSQIYNMIWRAAKDAAAYYVRERVSKQHAANTVVGAIQRYAERAKAEGWEVKPYGRDRRCPQSFVSEIFFNTVLQIGADGFDEAPPVANG